MGTHAITCDLRLAARLQPLFSFPLSNLFICNMAANRVVVSRAVRVSAAVGVIATTAILSTRGALSSAAAITYSEVDAAFFQKIIELEFPNCLIKDGGIQAHPLCHSTVSSAIECQDKCAANPNCAIFTYYPSISTCALMRYTSDMIFKAEIGAVMGPRVCRSECKEEGFVSGPTVRVIADGSVTTLRECLGLCHGNHNCSYATFDYSADVCYLIGERQGDTKVERGVVSAAKRCTHRDASVAKQMTVVGTDLVKDITTTTWQECRAQGKFTPSCTFWSWDSNTKACKLVGGPPVGVIRPKTGSFAGPTWPGTANCINAGTKYTSQGDKEVVATSEIDCQRQCGQSGDCSFFSYHAESSVCLLLESNPQNFSQNTASGWVGGPPYCFPQDWCVLPAVRYDGTSLIDTIRDDEMACRQACSSNLNCQVWRFNTTTFICSIMRDEALDKAELRGSHVSGLSSCGSQDACQQENQDYGQSQFLEDISLAFDVKRCQELCYDKPRCSFYAMLPSGVCRLYPESAQPRASPGSVSGPAMC